MGVDFNIYQNLVMLEWPELSERKREREKKTNKEQNETQPNIAWPCRDFVDHHTCGLFCFGRDATCWMSMDCLNIIWSLYNTKGVITKLIIMDLIRVKDMCLQHVLFKYFLFSCFLFIRIMIYYTIFYVDFFLIYFKLSINQLDYKSDSLVYVLERIKKNVSAIFR